jgi:hypothetical protein
VLYIVEYWYLNFTVESVAYVIFTVLLYIVNAAVQLIGLDLTIVQNALTSIGLAHLAYLANLALNVCGEIQKHFDLL